MFHISNRLENMIYREINNLSAWKEKGSLNSYGEGMLYAYKRVIQAAKRLDEEQIEDMAIENISVCRKERL